MKKSLLGFLIVFIFVNFHSGCKKVEENVIEYRTMIKVTYERIEPRGYHWADKYIAIMINLNQPGELYETMFALEVRTGSLEQIGPDKFEGYIKDKVAIDRIHEAYVLDDSLPRLDGIDVNCTRYTVNGLYIEGSSTIDEVRMLNCPHDAPSRKRRFKITKQ